jgi:tripartite-type tricarboxylate transporter receptor subunit TctC
MTLQRRAWLKAVWAVTAATAASAAPRLAQANNWPTKPVRIVVPVAPGGSLDTLARTVAKELTARLGQAVLVENLPGAGSNIAFGHVAKAAPDGYTLLLGWDSLVINPSLYPNVPYTLAQFAPITLAITSPQVLLVGTRLPAKTLAEFLDIARTAPARVTLANAGNGSPGHLAGTLLETRGRVRFTNVPYQGGGPAVNDLLAGHVDALFVTLPAALQHVKSGRLRALGVSSATRSTGAPEVPTLAEAGLPGYELNSWQGFLAPAGTAAEVIATLSKTIVEVLRDPAIKAQLVAQGFEIVGSTPEALARELVVQTPRWAQLVKDSGARIE